MSIVPLLFAISILVLTNYIFNVSGKSILSLTIDLLPEASRKVIKTRS